MFWTRHGSSKLYEICKCVVIEAGIKIVAFINGRYACSEVFKNNFIRLFLRITLIVWIMILSRFLVELWQTVAYNKILKSVGRNIRAVWYGSAGLVIQIIHCSCLREDAHKYIFLRSKSSDDKPFSSVPLELTWINGNAVNQSFILKVNQHRKKILHVFFLY